MKAIFWLSTYDKTKPFLKKE